MFAGHQAAVAIPRVAVGVVRRLVKNGAVLDRVPAHPVVRNVAPGDAAVLPPDRPLAPRSAGLELFERGVRIDQCPHARILNDDAAHAVRPRIAAAVAMRAASITASSLASGLAMPLPAMS